MNEELYLKPEDQLTAAEKLEIEMALERELMEMNSDELDALHIAPFIRMAGYKNEAIETMTKKIPCRNCPNGNWMRTVEKIGSRPVISCYCPTISAVTWREGGVITQTCNQQIVWLKILLKQAKTEAIRARMEGENNAI